MKLAATKCPVSSVQWLECLLPLAAPQQPPSEGAAFAGGSGSWNSRPPLKGGSVQQQQQQQQQQQNLPPVPRLLLRVADTLVHLELTNCGLDDDSLHAPATTTAGGANNNGSGGGDYALGLGYDGESSANDSHTCACAVFRAFLALAVLDLSGNHLTKPPRLLPPRLRTLRLAHNVLSSLAYLDTTGRHLRRKFLPQKNKTRVKSPI